jgi:large subunit ribosomal protein L4
MPNVDVVNLNNEKVGEVALEDSVFAAPVNDALLYESVRHHQAGERRGTAKTKVRREVSGSGKKLWKQKGTGRARVGSLRSPIWRHGGTVHGPQPRSYEYAFPRKKVRGAMRSALSARFQENCLTVVDAFQLGSHKTKDLKKSLAGFAAGRKILLIDVGENRELKLSSRNLPKVKLVPGQGVNIHDVVNHEVLIFSKEAILQVQEVLSR